MAQTTSAVFIEHFYITDQVLRLAQRQKTFSRSVLQPCNRRQFKFYLCSQFSIWNMRRGKESVNISLSWCHEACWWVESEWWKLIDWTRPSPGLMGQLMLVGCYDNVSRIIICSTINFSSIKYCSAGLAWERLGQARREYQVIWRGLSQPIYSNVIPMGDISSFILLSEPTSHKSQL